MTRNMFVHIHLNTNENKIKNDQQWWWNDDKINTKIFYFCKETRNKRKLLLEGWKQWNNMGII